MIMLRRVLMVGMVAFSGLAQAAPDAAEAVREALRNTGVATHIASIGDMVQNGIDQRANEEREDGHDTKVYEDLRRVLTAAYDQTRIEQRVTDVLVKRYDPNRFQVINNGFSTDQAKRLRALKEQAASKDNVEAVKQYAKQHPKLSEARETLLKELDSASAESELSAGVQALVGAGMLDAMGAVKRAPDQAIGMPYQNKVELYYSQTVEPTEVATLKLFRYAFRDVADDALQQYARLYRSKATQWFIQQSIDALMKVMGQIDAEVMKSLAANAPQK